MHINLKKTHLYNMKRIVFSIIAFLLVGVSYVFAVTPINVGIVLPLHNNDGDGLRAIEYYRGLILAAEELKSEGVEVNFYAWNVHKDADVTMILQDPNAKKCDIFFGPMYTKQVAAIQAFAAKQNSKVIIPFSISESPSSKYKNVFQIYQEPSYARANSIKKFAEFFNNYQVVIVGCNDANTTKGDFTADLKKSLAANNTVYTMTNLTTKDDLFVKAFNDKKPNVVILNSASNASVKEVFKKLDAVKKLNPNITISLFGYTEWLMYTNAYADQFHKFDTYIPTHSYYNPQSPDTKIFELQYKKHFNAELLTSYNPRFGIMGYDHGRFFFRGFSKMGREYKGAYANNDALQSRIHFARVGSSGGMQNVGFKFIHFNRNKSISEVAF